MKNILSKGLIALLITIVFVACKKDDSCSISAPVTGAFVEDWGESTTIKFETSNVETVTVTATNGWSGVANLATHTLTITAPESEDAENAGTKTAITLSAVSPGGAVSSATVNAYIVPGIVDLSADGTSNCYIATSPNTRYRFNTGVKGESGGALATASIDIVWQTHTPIIRYLTLDNNGYANFYVDYASGSETELREGNALIGAYNSAGELIWSWHIWLTNSDPRTEEGVATYTNGVTFMARNLGAAGNSAGSTATDDILASYGLYYQWGRKDPLPRPRYYNCAGSYNEALYNGKNTAIYYSVEETDAKKGTVAYATANPLTMLIAPESNNGDWYYGGSSTLWSSSEKSVYDPCPKGWTVPDADAFTTLDIAEEDDNMDLEVAKKSFGWFLSDANGEKHFYTGAGYRSYFNGTISNVNYKDEYPYTPVPWIGYYWTTGVDGSNAIAMFFDLNTSRAAINAFSPKLSEHRANAMQVRCVKVK